MSHATKYLLHRLLRTPAPNLPSPSQLIGFNIGAFPNHRQPLVPSRPAVRRGGLPSKVRALPSTVNILPNTS